MISTKLRLPTLGLLTALAALSGGCTLESSPNEVAPVSSLGYREAGRAAMIVEDLGDGRISGPAEGTSMQPLYGKNAYLVINPINYDELKPGMVVAYKDLSGRKVVHALLAKEGKYWTVQGINNAFEDPDYVTPENLLGVVYGSFHAIE
ncbi:S24/S26 family peptidase [Cerasicoccus arenae]|uniref:S24 family peptidase n=1 Tax=Cerasicoccus arenae TaxID=424488 RepID=A0A8J3DHV4_9BACT|nr:S24/S26 family peptidase [Cerasicoccus arenae]MBK1858971.1 S24/S26 family peptidase [Cerasicoccus arenae]GHC04168.1 hypothetical protein GCM10007047_21060 [Cerasicoccus arenae]